MTPETAAEPLRTRSRRRGGGDRDEAGRVVDAVVEDAVDADAEEDVDAVVEIFDVVELSNNFVKRSFDFIFVFVDVVVVVEHSVENMDFDKEDDADEDDDDDDDAESEEFLRCRLRCCRC